MFIVRGFVITGCCLLVLACGFVGLCQKSKQNQSTGVEDPISQEIAFHHDGLGYGAYLAGTLARQNQDYELTAQYYEKVLAQDPENKQMKVKVYLLKALQGKFDEMAPLVSEMVALRQPELLADYVAAVLAIKRGEYQVANELLERKPNYELDTILLPTIQAWMQHALGHKEDARKKLKVLLDDDKTHPFYWYYTGLMAIADQNVAEADMAFQKMADKTYPSLTALVFVRDFYQKQEKWQEGFGPRDKFDAMMSEQVAANDVIRFLKAPEMITPEIGVAIALYDLSSALGPLRIQETSLVFNELSLYLAPDATIPKIWSGEIFESMGAKKQANAVYDRIRNPSDIILFKKAINLVQLKSSQMALPILKELTVRNQANPLIQMLLAEAYAQNGDLTQAVSAYEKAILIMIRLGQTSELGAALFALGTVYDEMGDKEAAEQKLLASLKVAPNNPMALNHLGYMWLEGGKNESQAFTFVERAHQLAPEDPHIMDSLALGYYRRQEYQKALDLAERSTDLMPYSSIANGRLGDIYAALGRYREAVYQYRKALDLKADITIDLRQELLEKVSRLEK